MRVAVSGWAGRRRQYKRTARQGNDARGILLGALKK